MLQIYHSTGTRGFRVIWVCEELGAPYEIMPVDFSAEYRASPEWRALNPVGKVPVMTDGDLTMYESCAIMQYVLDRYGEGKLQPAKTDASYAHYLQWCWFAESTFARPLGEITNHRRAFQPQLDDVVAEMQGRGTACVEALDDALSDRPFLLGDTMSAADISMAYVMRGYQKNVTETLPANVQAFFDRMTALPSFARTLKADASASERLKA
jgi:glutathione S-transferase